MSANIETRLDSLYIELNSHCNEKCIYCYNEKIISKKEYLPIEKVEDIVTQSKELGIHSIALSGGEPMLHPNFFAILKMLFENEMKVTVITNCSKIKDKEAQLVAKYKPNIQITIDSGLENIHDMSRGIGTLKKQESALDLLKRFHYAGEIDLRCNLWKGNIDDKSVESVLQFAKKYEINYVKFSLAHRTETFNKDINDEDIEVLIEKIDVLKQKYETINIEFSGELVSYGCPFINENKAIDCGFRIAPDGFVYPCQLFSQKQYRLGNVYRSSIGDILHGQELQHFLKLIQVRKYFIEECKTCICQGVCSAGCPAIACLENGNILSIAGNCGRRKKEVMSVFSEQLQTQLANN